MRTPLAWRNITHARMRAFSALCGISFAILLIFMQLGFRASAQASAIQVFDALDFDLILLSPNYSFIARPGAFDRGRLEQARALPGVEKTTPVWIGFGEWRNPETRHGWGMLILGVEPADRPFRQAVINDQLPALGVPDTALIDRLSRPEFGKSLPVGLGSEVDGRRLRLAGDFRVGTGFVSGSTTIVSRQTLRRLTGTPADDEISLGLVKLAPGVSAEETARALAPSLAPQAEVFTRAQLLDREQDFWLNTKPIGIMFTSGVFVAFVVGAVILYQVLASEVQNRMREYATLKAVGYDDGFIYSVVLRQGLILAGLGFLPAMVWSALIYYLLRTQALLPVDMTLARAGLVLGLTVFMALVASFFAVRKLRAADPADLF